jgi:hypothetical protein
MIEVDCSELSGDAKLKLAVSISEGLEGTGIALLNGDDIVVDQLSGRKVENKEVQSLVEGFFSSGKKASLYRVESIGSTIVVHSAEPVPADRKKVTNSLPPGFFQCSVCGFVAASKAKYDNHVRMHDLMRGLAR